MFGMSLPEILIIAVIAVLFLGPDKLPEAMVQIAKFFKTLKKGVNDAKASFESEIKIAELKQDAAKYKQSLEEATSTVRKKLTFEELDEIKKKVNESKEGLERGLNAIKDPVSAVKNELKDAALSTKSSEPNSANALNQQNFSPANSSNDAGMPAGGRRAARMSELSNKDTTNSEVKAKQSEPNDTDITTNNLNSKNQDKLAKARAKADALAAKEAADV